jgi:uncharacterized protein (TIGR03437 family)
MRTCCVLLLSLSGVAISQTAGTFAATGNLTTGRFHNTATLLPDGKVLIAGGTYSTPPIPTTPFFNFLASAELYDPATGKFTPTGSMSAHRAFHTAILLSSGKVLIVGGGYSPSAELYDPATGTFFPTGDMLWARTTPPTATLLNDGRVLIAGGGLGSFALTEAELYDPSSGTFTAAGSMNKPRYAGVASMLSNGKVLVDGGVVLPDIDASEIYDPVTASFALAGAGVYINGDGPVEATVLTSGKVLEILGPGPFCEDDCDSSNDAVLYDPVASTFTATGKSTSTRGLIDGYDTAITLLPNGAVLIAGSGLGELFDPASSAFTSTAPMVIVRSGHTATLLTDGTVLVAGGQDAGGLIAGTTAEIYRPEVLIPAPVLFSLSGDGRGQGAIWNAQTGQIVSAANPGVAGNVLSMYTTSLVEGGVIPPHVAIGGQLAEVLYFGEAPGFPGYFQVNFRVPNGVAPGAAVLARLTYLGRPSNEVTIGVEGQ